MLVRYRFSNNISIEQFKGDVEGIINGSISNVNQLSNSCNISLSSIDGTYPSGIYAISNTSSTTTTISKIHGTSNTYTHYIRIGYSATSMTGLSLAQSYTSATDTLINSSSNNFNFVPVAYNSSSSFPSELLFVFSSKALVFASNEGPFATGVFDIGSNDISENQTDNMRMSLIRLSDSAFTIPYGYFLSGQFSGYSSLSGTLSNLGALPTIKTNANSSVVIAENPTFVSHTSQGFISYQVDSLRRVATNMLRTPTVYNNSSKRVSAFNYSILSE